MDWYPQQDPNYTPTEREQRLYAWFAVVAAVLLILALLFL